MKITPIIKCVALSSMLLSSCQRGNLRKVVTKNEATLLSDSLYKATNSVKNDKSLKCFYRDTVCVSEFDLKHPQAFVENLKLKALSSIPEKNVPSRQIVMPPNCCIGILGKSKFPSTATVPSFIEGSVKTVVEKDVFVDNSKSVYFSVSAYAKENPVKSK